MNNINANNRPALGAGNQAGGQPNWKGQSTYQGARPNNANQKPGASMANANPANRPNTGHNASHTKLGRIRQHLGYSESVPNAGTTSC